MANPLLNTGTVVSATSNPETNIQQLNGQVQQVQPINNSIQQQPNTISPITIPIQLQPQISTNPQPIHSQLTTNNIQNPQNNQVISTAPTPKNYKESNNQNTVDFNQIYNNYQNTYGNNQTNSNIAPSGIKKTSVGTTIVTPTTANINSVKGQYQSAFSNTINSLISEMLSKVSNGFQYDPTQDTSLKIATEYAANNTLQNLAGSGVLNSSATSERVARIVSELIPQYEKIAHDRWLEQLGQLADTAQIVMNYDSQQFQYWKDAKDREFEEKEFEFAKKQTELENAWK